MLKINTEQICTIRVCEKEYNMWYEYRKQKKLFGIVTRNEGFYYRKTLSPFLVSIFRIHELERNQVYIEGHKVFYKPHVEIRMSNGIMYEKFFETKGLLNEFLQSDYIKNIKLITK